MIPWKKSKKNKKNPCVGCRHHGDCAWAMSHKQCKKFN